MHFWLSQSVFLGISCWGLRLRNTASSLLMNWFSCLLSIHWNPNWTKGFPSSFSSFTSSYSRFHLSKFFKLTFFFFPPKWFEWERAGQALTLGGLSRLSEKESSGWRMCKPCFRKSLSDKFFPAPPHPRAIIPDGKEPTFPSGIKPTLKFGRF